MKQDKSADKTNLAFENPQSGDHFCEMASFHMFVVWAHDGTIITCSAAAPCRFPQDGKWSIYHSLKQFQDANKYKTYSDTRSCDYSIRYYNRVDHDITWWLNFAPHSFKAELDPALCDTGQRNFSLCENTPFGWLP